MVEIDKQYEEFKELFSRNLGLLNLGNVFVNESNQILCDKKEGKVFLEFDEETYKLYQFLIKKDYKPYNKPSLKYLTEELNTTLGKLKRSIEKLKKNSLNYIFLNEVEIKR